MSRLVLMVGYWLPTIPYCRGGPRAGTFGIAEDNDEKRVEELLSKALLYLEKWPVSDFEWIAFEDLTQARLQEMSQRIHSSYQEWFTQDNYNNYLERRRILNVVYEDAVQPDSSGSYESWELGSGKDSTAVGGS